MVSNLIFNQYKLPISQPNFQLFFTDFLKINFFKLYFNCYLFINSKVLWTNFLFNNKNLYGWEIISIINFILKKINSSSKSNLLLDDYLITIFNNFYIQKEKNNWKIPFYVMSEFDSFYETQQLILFIKNQYPNIDLKPLIINKKNKQLNLINKSYALIMHNSPSVQWIKYKNIYSINYYSFILNNNKLELIINKLMFSKIISRIFIFEFFINHQFFNFKNLISMIQESIVRKYKLNIIFFELENSFIDTSYVKSNMLLIHKLIPFNNIDVPIILIYLDKPIIFQKKYLINFIFILINKSNMLYQNHWLLLFLEKFRNSNKTKISTVDNLYLLINSSLTT